MTARSLLVALPYVAALTLSACKDASAPQKPAPGAIAVSPAATQLPDTTPKSNANTTDTTAPDRDIHIAHNSPATPVTQTDSTILDPDTANAPVEQTEIAPTTPPPGDRPSTGANTSKIEIRVPETAHTPETGQNTARDRNITPVLETRTTEPNTPAPATGISAGLTILLVLLSSALIIALIALWATTTTIMRWRRTVHTGMEAVVPTRLEADLSHAVSHGIDELSARQTTVLQQMSQAINQISEEQRHQDSMLNRLRAELDRKDADNKLLRSLVLSGERDTNIRRVIKLSNFVGMLRRQSAGGTIAAADALAFLSEEVADSLAELGIETFVPPVGSMLQAHDPERIEIVSTGATFGTGAPSAHSSIADVLAPAYLRLTPTGEMQVLQRARVSIALEPSA